MAQTDVIIVGLGAAGAATLHQLTRRGARAVGIDRFSPPHPHGSTHGDTRITRLAIGEGAVYTPLVTRSHEIWRELEAETGVRLLTQNGGLVIESPRSDHSLHHAHGFLDSTIACARRYGIEHEALTAEQMSLRFPQFSLAGDERGYYEPGAGFVRPETCVATQLDAAARAGAVVRRDETVIDLTRDGSGVRVRTNLATHVADRVVLCVGPWLADFLPASLRGVVSVYRQVLIWYGLRPDAPDHSPDAMPVFIWGLAGDRHFYGFPAIDGPGGGLKVATEQFDETTTAATAALGVDAAEADELHEQLIRDQLPGVTDRCVKAVRCLYTTTRDGHFLVDWHPDIDGVLLVSPCSGHGFKHSAGLGDALAAWLTSGASDVDLSPFRIDRLIQV